MRASASYESVQVILPGSVLRIRDCVVLSGGLYLQRNLARVAKKTAVFYCVQRGILLRIHVAFAYHLNSEPSSAPTEGVRVK